MAKIPATPLKVDLSSSTKRERERAPEAPHEPQKIIEKGFQWAPRTQEHRHDGWSKEGLTVLYSGPGVDSWRDGKLFYLVEKKSEKIKKIEFV